MGMDLSVLDAYGKSDPQQVEQQLKPLLLNLRRKIVVLDDDPTGVQTVHGVSVYTQWSEKAILAGFREKSPLFFVLTNSRSMPAQDTAREHRKIGKTLCAVSQAVGSDYILISRSDSTLRGHFPLETDALRESIEAGSRKRFDGEILIPFFLEGGRYTIDNVHYVKEGNKLTPAGETEFAKDKSFGYENSHLGRYVEEKTMGMYPQGSCTYISLEDLRQGNTEKITRQLMQVDGFRKVIVNAVDYGDVKQFMVSYLQTLKGGKEFIFRSAAAVPKVLGGIGSKPLLTREELIDPGNANGGIVLIGSHVHKTTQQFLHLHKCRAPMELIQFDQHQVARENGLEQEAARVVQCAETAVRNGRNAVVYTRRERFDLDTQDRELQLRVSSRISDAVTSVVAKLSVRPSFIIAKGGITSSDVGTKALQVKRARVMGQIQPGIPVWMTGAESKFPSMPYIIFPGNVGEVDTLKKIVDLLSLGIT